LISRAPHDRADNEHLEGTGYCAIIFGWKDNSTKLAFAICIIVYPCFPHLLASLGVFFSKLECIANNARLNKCTMPFNQLAIQ
jgi:hypothetical protein